MKCTSVSLSDVNIIPNRTGNLKILISPKKCPSTSLVLGYSTLKVGEVLKRHIHDYSDEAFFVIDGKGLLKTNEGELAFVKNDAVHIPKETEHVIINTGEQDLTVIFCVSPLAPSPELGHREIDIIGEPHA